MDWTKNQSTTWENLQAGDPFVLGGILASACIHCQYWRDIFTASRPQITPPPLTTMANMQLWFAAQSVPRKWAERLVSIEY